MKILIMLGISLLGAAVDVRAATIILKDHRVITGDIIEQDKTKVVVKSDDISLTYYVDEIVSIDGNPLVSVVSHDVALDPEKELLIQQYLDIFPTLGEVSDYVDAHYPEDKQQAIVSALSDYKNIAALRELRIEGLRQYFSKEDLKLAIRLYSSVEGKSFFKAAKQYQINTMTKTIVRKLQEEAIKVTGKTEVK